MSKEGYAYGTAENKVSIVVDTLTSCGYNKYMDKTNNTGADNMNDSATEHCARYDAELAKYEVIRTRAVDAFCRFGVTGESFDNMVASELADARAFGPADGTIAQQHTTAAREVAESLGEVHDASWQGWE